MKNDESREIGELIQEIISSGFILETNGQHSRLRTLRGEEVILRTGGSILERLGFMVDFIRVSNGKPTREKELAKMLEADQTHADAPPVEIGPDACCGCGSRKPLIVERKLSVGICWEMGEPTFLRGLTCAHYPRPGEIGTCPDCGRHYTFGA